MTDTSSQPEGSHALQIERTFDASREAVFDAWTKPEVLKRWFAAGIDWETVEVEVDLRVGGSYRLTMRDPAGAEYTATGEYREIDRPARLVYTWRHDLQSTAALVTVEFVGVRAAENPRTTVHLHAVGYLSSGVRDRNNQGWGRCLDNLERRIYPSVSIYQ